MDENFSFILVGDQLTKQKDGVLTGGSPSPIIANTSVLTIEQDLYCSNVSNNLLLDTQTYTDHLSTLKYPTWLDCIILAGRLMDDGLIILYNYLDLHIDTVINHINNIYKINNLSIEGEYTISDKPLTYLDLDLYIDQGQIHYQTHFKKEKSEFYLTPQSNNPQFQIMNIIPN